MLIALPIILSSRKQQHDLLYLLGTVLRNRSVDESPATFSGLESSEPSRNVLSPEGSQLVIILLVETENFFSVFLKQTKSVIF